MTKDKAIEILENLRKQTQASGEAHDLLREALETIKKLVEPTG